MAYNPNKNYVYKKDREGSTYKIGEIVFDNQIIQHPACLTNVCSTLKTLPKFPTRKDDIWIIAFPKSGTHWLNEIVSLLTKNVVTKPLEDKQRKFIELCGRTEFFEEMSSPRSLNTHLHLKFMPEHILENARILFPLRNPKSVAVSHFYHRRNIPEFEYEGCFKGFLPSFIEGIESLHGNWFEMVLPYWVYLRGKSNALFVIYEDLIKNPVEGIKTISDFLHLDHDVTFCRQVAEKASFGAMQDREQQVLSTLSKGAHDGFIRKGSTTDWKTHFTVAQNEMFDAVYEEKMKDYPDLKEKIKFA